MIDEIQYISSDEFLEKKWKKHYYLLSTNTYRQCSKTNLQIRVYPPTLQVTKLMQNTVGKLPDSSVEPGFHSSGQSQEMVVSHFQ